jgi:hypothetical protein
MTFLRILSFSLVICFSISSWAHLLCDFAFMTSKHFDFNVFGNAQLEIFKTEIKNQTGYEVLESPALRTRQAPLVEGLVDPFSQKILILESLRPVEKFFVLNHEKTHAEFARNLTHGTEETFLFWSTSVQLYQAQSMSGTSAAKNLAQAKTDSSSNDKNQPVDELTIDQRLPKTYSRSFLLEEVNAYFLDAQLAHELLVSQRLTNPRVIEYLEQFMMESKFEALRLAEVSSDILNQMQFVFQKLLTTSQPLSKRVVSLKYKAGKVFFVEFAIRKMDGKNLLISMPLMAELAAAPSLIQLRYLLTQTEKAQTEVKKTIKELQQLNPNF